MRIFIALEIPDKVQEEIVKIQTKLRASFPAGRWVTKQNLHMTLLFLGEQNNQGLHKTKAMLSAVSQNPFSLAFQALDGFPDKRRPRIICIRCAGETELNRIVTSLQKQCFEHNLLSGKMQKFTPHITIARIKKPQLMPEKFFIQENIKPTAWEISTVSLFESIQTPQGSIYRKIGSKKLATERTPAV